MTRYEQCEGLIISYEIKTGENIINKLRACENGKGIAAVLVKIARFQDRDKESLLSSGESFVKTVIPTEIYSRVVGYYRPVSQWNKGKQEEFCERKESSAAQIELITREKASI